MFAYSRKNWGVEKSFGFRPFYQGKKAASQNEMIFCTCKKIMNDMRRCESDRFFCSKNQVEGLEHVQMIKMNYWMKVNCKIFKLLAEETIFQSRLNPTLKLMFKIITISREDWNMISTLILFLIANIVNWDVSIC